ncbi:condensation domain-containing protein [Streptomyces sp. NPDC057116]|uniref:condensation domain-containing protein n=1 Tax=Streptomyces sp. NPDC057116 TaxID=3346023 RepID=UPI00363B7DD0
MAETAPLSLGQLSVWHDIRDLPPSRRHEPNNAAVWALPRGTRTEAVGAALHALALRHPSLRTRYDLHDPDEPRQLRPDAEIRATVDLTDTGGDDERPLTDTALALAARPFDLGREHGWRARLVTRGAAPSHLVFVKHHIVADAWAQEQLHHELLREISDPGRLGPPPPGPAELAADQYSPAGLRRQRAALAHWEHVLDAAPPTALPRDAEAPGTAVQGTLTSAGARTAARTIAAREGVSVAGVVLAAFAGAVARRCHPDGHGSGTGGERLMVQLMSANRFTARWRDTVTSMNQWVPALIEDTGAPLADLARAAHWSGLAAFRHGTHDVRAVAALRAARTPGAPEAACAFNFVAVPPAAADPLPDGRDTAPDRQVPAPDAPGAGTEGEATLVWEEPFTTIGPRCYARALEDEHTLSVRLTAKDLRRETCAALLWDLHDTLLTAAHGHPA